MNASQAIADSDPKCVMSGSVLGADTSQSAVFTVVLPYQTHKLLWLKTTNFVNFKSIGTSWFCLLAEDTVGSTC